jgi:hypothetical protein
VSGPSPSRSFSLSLSLTSLSYERLFSLSPPSTTISPSPSPSPSPRPSHSPRKGGFYDVAPAALSPTAFNTLPGVCKCLWRQPRAMAFNAKYRQLASPGISITYLYFSFLLTTIKPRVSLPSSPPPPFSCQNSAPSQHQLSLRHLLPRKGARRTLGTITVALARKFRWPVLPPASIRSRHLL